MNLLFLSNEYPNTCDPHKATFNRAMIRSLATMHDVEVVSPIPWTDELRFRLRNGNHSIQRSATEPGIRISYPRYLFTPRFFRHRYSQFMEWSLRGSMQATTERSRPDCVLSYWAHPDGDCANRIARSLGVPSLVMVGGSDVLLMTRDPKRRACIQESLRNADGVLAVSHDLAKHVYDLGVDPRHIHVVRRGVDTSRFQAGSRVAARHQLDLDTETPQILWVGRLVAVKGVDTLVATCRALASRQTNFQVNVIGEGPLRESAERELQRDGLEQFVRFVGPVDHNELPVWFQASDLTLLTSRSEGIPNVLLESLACGTPFVASNVGGIPEIADHEGAILVEPGDTLGFCNAIEHMVEYRTSVPESAKPDSLAEAASQITRIAYEVAPALRPESAHASSFTERAPVSGTSYSSAIAAETETLAGVSAT